MKKFTILLAFVLLLVMSVGVQANSADTYLVTANGQSFASDFAAQVDAKGGTLVAQYPFGVAVIETANASALRRIRGVKTIIADVGFDVERAVHEVLDTEDGGFPPNSGNDDERFDFQWGHNFVGAQEAWAAGVTGQGVRVAVIDGGFDTDHPDLEPNINMELSRDFTGEGLEYTLNDPFSHGTHVAGTILAADNGSGVIGVAPDAELVALKALGDAGSGSFVDIIAAIYYAAMIDVDVINMSLGVIIPRTSDPAGVSALDNALSQAVAFAFQQGTTTIVSAGNAATNLDGDADNVRFNSTARHVIEISALTTLNWASDPENATLVPSSYTNYGTSGVTFGAPGGSSDYPGNEICQVSNRILPCWVFDLVYSSGSMGSYYWSAGTSMAAPHAAGVAALIISANGGDMHPAQVEAALRSYSIDMGKPGRDDFFGHGVTHSGYGN